jgi:hypothetical protein
MLKGRLNGEPFRSLFGKYDLSGVKFTGDGKEAERKLEEIIARSEESGSEWDGVAMSWTGVRVIRVPERDRKALEGLKYIIGVDEGFGSMGPFD